MSINTIYAYDDMKKEDCVISEWRHDTDLDDYMEISSAHTCTVQYLPAILSLQICF
jgi:hypothetical protein